MSDTPYGSERCFVCDGLVSASALTPRVTFAGRQHPYHDECGVKFLINFLLTRKKNQIGRARGSTITLDEMNLDARLEKEYEESLPKRLELVL